MPTPLACKLFQRNREYTEQNELCDPSVKIVVQLNKLKLSRPKSNLKWEHMKLDRHLQASVMAGLIGKYRGASNYINDELNPAQVTRTLICRIQERKELIDLKKFVNREDVLHLFRELMESSEATHVVEGITYGAEVYCVVSLEVDESENEEEARDKANENLSNMISKLENALADKCNFLEFQSQFDEEEQEINRRVKCRIYADGQSQIVRECSLLSAYKHCLKLVEQIQADDGKIKAVPINVQLCPLKIILNTATGGADFRLPEYDDVGDDLLDRCSHLVANLEAIKAKVKASEKASRWSTAITEDPSWREFQKATHQFQKLLMEKLKKSVISARKGDIREVQKAVDIAETHANFKLSQLEQWLNWKLSEINMIKEIAELTGITITSNRSELERRLVESKKHALVLNVPALDEHSKKILKGMKKYVDNYNTLVAVQTAQEPNKDDDKPWHTVHHEQLRLMAKIRDLVDHMKRNKQVRFFITLCNHASHPDEPRYFYSVYQANNLLKDNLADLPSPPTSLRIHPEGPTTANSFRLVWDYKNLGYSCHFLVQYRPKGSIESWEQKKTTKSGENQMVISFEEDLPVEFRVAADTCIGASEFSSIVDTESTFDDVETQEDVTANDLQQFSSAEDPSFAQGTNEEDDLLDSTAALDREFVDWEVYSNASSEIVSLTALDQGIRYAEALVKRCQKVNNRNGMDIYAVPLAKSKILKTAGGATTVERYSFGQSSAQRGSFQQQNGGTQQRTILMMGATGSGKTTLINGMINYIFNVQWDDPFRFTLVDEKVAAKSQAESQTSCIKVYDIHHVEGFRVPYSLTIVDTPGYGDTKGLERDQEITQMVKEFFEVKGGIQELDVIGFVVPASLPRLTPTQTYIFDSVLSIFGNDVKENINFLLTFSDSQEPPVLSAITEANLPCLTDPETRNPFHHKFNNSGFFCSNHGSGNMSTVDKFNKFFWRMGMENFEKFFKVLATMNTKSLSLTKQVLDERKRLEATITALQPLIKTGLAKMEEMRKTKQMISNCQAQIEAGQNTNFDVDVIVPQRVAIPPGQYVTNCNKCHTTCHFPCTIPNDDGKAKCRAMKFFLPESMRTCWNCPNRCHWTLHSNQTYKWQYVTQTKTTSSEAIKQKYEAQMKRKLTAEELIRVLEKDVEAISSNVLQRVNTVTGCIQQLDEIALRPNPFSTPQYIDLIIDAEQQEKKVGFKERIESLKKLRQMAEIQNKIRNQEQLMSLPPTIDRPGDLDGENQAVASVFDDASSIQRLYVDDDRNSVVSSATSRNKLGNFFSSVLNR